MKISKCFFCNKISATPYQVTEIIDEKVDTFDMCQRCAQEYLQDIDKTKTTTKPKSDVDLTEIKTSQDLIKFITNIQSPAKSVSSCECGWSEHDFNTTGRFGCPKCYDHFHEKVEQLVFPYHRSNEHIGKTPRRATKEFWESSKEEKLKMLKLQLAQAIELEKYEKAGELNVQIKNIEN